MADGDAGALAKKASTTPRVRAYREFLTPLLHRRFVTAAFLALAVCYADAVVLGWQSSITLLPFTSIFRALLLFIPALIIFLLRVSQLRLKERISVSPFKGAVVLLTAPGTYQVFVFYLFSGWLFSEIHIHSAPYEADLGWVVNGGSYDRLRLNERVIFLRCHALTMALVQAYVHVRNDYSYMEAFDTPLNEPSGQSLSTPEPLKLKLQRILPKLVQKTLKRTFMAMGLNSVAYRFVRPTAWRWSLSAARLVWNIPLNQKPNFVASLAWYMIVRTGLQGILLFGIWEISNSLFTLLVAQEPVKHNKPLTAESKTPNWSLVNGLRSRKSPVKTFALWELQIIGRRFSDRRKSIFTEIDRAAESTWDPVVESCLNTIKQISLRIKGPPPAPIAITSPDTNTSMPRIATPPKKDLVAEGYKPRDGLQKFTSFIDAQARKAGSAPPGSQLDLSPSVKKYLGDARDKLLTPEQQQAISLQALEASAHTFLARLLKFKVPETFFVGEFQPGVLFQETFGRQIRSKVFGKYFSDKTNIFRAVDVLALLLVSSITEDTYGVVSKNVPTVWRLFIDTIDNIETLLITTPIHWTDVNFTKSKKHDHDTDELLRHLRTALKQLIDSFSNDASAMGLTPADMKNARRVVEVAKG